MLDLCFAAPRDQEPRNARDYSTISYWYKLVEGICARHQIKQADIYSRDKKGVTIGQIGKQRVFASRHKLETVVCQSNNRE